MQTYAQTDADVAALSDFEAPVESTHQYVPSLKMCEAEYAEAAAAPAFVTQVALTEPGQLAAVTSGLKPEEVSLPMFPAAAVVQSVADDIAP